MRSSASASRLFEHNIFSALDLALLQSSAAAAGTGAASMIATVASKQFLINSLTYVFPEGRESDPAF